MYIYNTSIIYTYVLLFAEGAKVLLDTDTAGIGLYSEYLSLVRLLPRSNHQSWVSYWMIVRRATRERTSRARRIIMAASWFERKACVFVALRETRWRRERALGESVGLRDANNVAVVAVAAVVVIEASAARSLARSREFKARCVYTYIILRACVSRARVGVQGVCLSLWFPAHGE